MMTTVEMILGVCAAALLALELRGVRTTLSLSFRGDIKRESVFLAQYGQAVATLFAGWLMAIARGHGDGPTQWRIFALVCGPVAIASINCALLKRVCGRHRPNRERAGEFTGLAWKHDNKRESFPSSHSACAFALTITLIYFWPEAALVFWLLAFITAALRYVLDAHFPSDVLAGSLLGLLIGHASLAGLLAVVGPVH